MLQKRWQTEAERFVREAQSVYDPSEDCFDTSLRCRGELCSLCNLTEYCKELKLQIEAFLSNMSVERPTRSRQLLIQAP